MGDSKPYKEAKSHILRKDFDGKKFKAGEWFETETDAIEGSKKWGTPYGFDCKISREPEYPWQGKEWVLWYRKKDVATGAV
jgi:hypothetical protein